MAAAKNPANLLETMEETVGQMGKSKTPWDRERQSQRMGKLTIGVLAGSRELDSEPVFNKRIPRIDWL